MSADDKRKAPPAATPKKKRKKGAGKKAAPGAKAAPPAPNYAPWWAAAVGSVALLGLTLWAWPPRPAPEAHVERGNAQYAQRHYQEALGEYEGAPGSGPRNAGVQLDRGLARYRIHVPQGDGGGLPLMDRDASVPEGLTRAQDELRTAARGGTTNAAEDVDAYLRARAAYDLANTFFSTHGWDNAIEAYKEALRLRPGWREAAWNLELARRLKEQEQNPPDAGQDASPDANQPPDAGNDGGQDGGDAGNDGGQDGGQDGGGRGDGGAGDSGSQQPDGGSQQPDGGSQQPDAGAGGQDAGQGPQDAGPPPRSLAPLDDLDRSSHSLQNELLQRRGAQPRGPDDDR